MYEKKRKLGWNEQRHNNTGQTCGRNNKISKQKFKKHKNRRENKSFAVGLNAQRETKV